MVSMEKGGEGGGQSDDTGASVSVSVRVAAGPMAGKGVNVSHACMHTLPVMSASS